MLLGHCFGKEWSNSVKGVQILPEFSWPEGHDITPFPR